MGVPTSEVGYTPAMPRREDREVHKDMWGIGEGKSRFDRILTKITGTLHEDRYRFLIISRSVLLRMRNVADKSCIENQNTHFTFNNIF